jgi:hypothetical protein
MEQVNYFIVDCGELMAAVTAALTLICHVII